MATKMKNLKRFLVILLLLGLVGLYLAITGGGDSFRWLGDTTEKAGETVRKTLDKTAETADEVREMAEKSAKGIEKLKEIKEELGKEDKEE